MSTSIAEEVLGNLTTVKSFAMEEEEVEKYGRSLDTAAAAYSRLGLGIGLFTAGSALATNGKMFLSHLINFVLEENIQGMLLFFDTPSCDYDDMAHDDGL